MKNTAQVLGICKGATIRVVGYVDIKNPNRLPKTQKELVALINSNENALALK